jgi:hypothetical protein
VQIPEQKMRVEGSVAEFGDPSDASHTE